MDNNQDSNSPLDKNDNSKFGAKPELHDIILDLRVEIGTAKIKIGELMNLSQGSVIHLMQKVHEPLVIYANDKAIAKGQIISANGKYNIRIL